MDSACRCANALTSYSWRCARELQLPVMMKRRAPAAAAARNRFKLPSPTGLKASPAVCPAAVLQSVAQPPGQCPMTVQSAAVTNAETTNWHHLDQMWSHDLAGATIWLEHHVFPPGI